MNQIEIIHLRLSGESVETLRGQIAASLRAVDPDTTVVQLYRRRGLETDVSVHIHHTEELAAKGRSDLGLRLASALKAYGLVEHTLWEELP